MTMRLSASIMAHPSRKESALRLRSAVEEGGREVPIAWDPNPVPSPDPDQRWATGRAAWEAHDPDADWHLVLQDDALVARDLLTGLERALVQLGRRGLVSAYTGTGRPHQSNVRRALAHAARFGHSWISTRSLNWGPAILAPVPSIPSMLAWCSGPRWDSAASRGRRRPEPRNYDYRIGVFYRDVLGWRTWYTIPSLVDTGREPSLIGNDRGPERLAHRFLGEDRSALDVDWSRTPPTFTPLLSKV